MGWDKITVNFCVFPHFRYLFVHCFYWRIYFELLQFQVLTQRQLKPNWLREKLLRWINLIRKLPNSNYSLHLYWEICFVVVFLLCMLNIKHIQKVLSSFRERRKLFNLFTVISNSQKTALNSFNLRNIHAQVASGKFVVEWEKSLLKSFWQTTNLRCNVLFVLNFWLFLCVRDQFST